MPGNQQTRAYVAIGIAMVSISFASVFTKWSNSTPFIIAAYRLAITTGILLPVMFWTGGFSELRSYNKKDIGLILISGVALAFHFGLWITSLTLTLVATSVILVTSHPIFVAGVSHFFLKERVRSFAAVGIVVAFSGVALISISDYSGGGEDLLGDLLAFLGGICAGVYFLSGRVARRKMSLTPYVFSVYGLSSILLFVAAAASGTVLLVVDSRELVLFLSLAIIPTIGGHTMFNYALKKVPAHIISTSVLGEPVGASILAALLLPNQIPGISIVIGGALVVGGLYIVLWKGYIPSEEGLDEAR